MKDTDNEKTALDDSSTLKALSLFSKKINSFNSKYELIDLFTDDISKNLGFSTISLFILVRENNERKLLYKGHSSKNILVDTDAEIAAHQTFTVENDPWLQHVLSTDDVVYASDMMKHPLTNKDIVKSLRIKSMLTRKIKVLENTLVVCASSYNYDRPIQKMRNDQIMYFDLMCTLINNIFVIKSLKNLRLFEENNLLSPIGIRWHISRLISSYSRNFKPFGIINITINNIAKDIYPDLLRSLAIIINPKLREHELLSIYENSIIICIEAIESFSLTSASKRFKNKFSVINYKGKHINLSLSVTQATCPHDGFGFDELISTSINRKAIIPAHVNTTVSAQSLLDQ